jgi:hypothetical protein
MIYDTPLSTPQSPHSTHLYSESFTAHLNPHRALRNREDKEPCNLSSLEHGLQPGAKVTALNLTPKMVTPLA